MATLLQVLPALDSGGVERGTVDLARYLVRHGHRAIVASAGGKLVAEIEAAGVMHLTLPLASKNPWRIYRNAQLLEDVIGDHGVELVHARSRAPAWSAQIAAERCNCPFVTTFHAIYGGYGNPLKRRYNSVMARGARVIAISDYVAEHVGDVYGVAPPILRTIHRGVDVDAFDPEQVDEERIRAVAGKFAVPDGMKIAMLPGRITRIKGHKLVIDAVTRLQRHDFAVLFVGPETPGNAYAAEVRAKIAATGLEQRVRFVGSCDDMPAALALADVVLAPSIGPEAFGRVSVEAQAMGTPVIVTAIGGPGRDHAAGGDRLAGPAERPDRTGHRPRTGIGHAGGSQGAVAGPGAQVGFGAVHRRADVPGDARRLSRTRAGHRLMAEILVIKHGALGDVVLATGAMQAIRRHHLHDRITLLTTRPFAKFLEPSGWFAEFVVDDQPTLWTPFRLLALLRRLGKRRFVMVYDLQTSQRTGMYFALWPRPRPRWSGIAKGCSHPDRDPQRTQIHTVARLKGQLAQAGIKDVPPPRVDFLKGDIAALAPAEPFALLVPGCAPHRPDKRWPAVHYGELANYLLALGMRPVLIGTAAEADAIKAILEVCPDALDLGGKTDFGQIAALARRAKLAVGNDTGPMHLIAAAPCPVLTLFSGASTPERSAPGWPGEPWLRREPLTALGLDEVTAALPRVG